MAASEFIVPQKYLRLGQKEVEPVLIETVVHLECKRLDGKGCSLLGRHDTWGALGDVSGPVHQGIRPHPLQPCT